MCTMCCLFLGVYSGSVYYTLQSSKLYISLFSSSVLSVVIVILFLIGDVTVLPHVQVVSAGVLLFFAESINL
jgi:hypothetical protein